MDPFALLLAGVAGVGKLASGFMGSAAAELQGKIAAGNTALLEKQAEIERMGADVALSKGVFEQTRLSDKVARVLAAQPGSYAAAGLSSTTPTALTAAGFSAAQGEADLEIIRANSALEAAAAKTRAANTESQAASSAYQQVALNQRAYSDRVAGIFGAATAFLSVGKSEFKGLGAPGDPLNINAPGYT